MAPDTPNSEPQPDPYLTPEVIAKSHGNTELRDLYVERDKLLDEGVARAQAREKITEDHLEKVREIGSRIREVREAMGLHPYE